MLGTVEKAEKVHTDQGEERNQVIFGGARATRFIKDVVAGKSVNGRKYKFDADFVLEIHNRIYYQEPNFKGGLRETDSTTVSDKPVAPAVEMSRKFHLFGRWLEDEMEKLKLNPDDIVTGLEVASAAHYGIVMPALHPFDNGNGRTARALMNAILMSQSYELTAFGLAIPPVPILRSTEDNGYIRALRTVDELGDLRPLMVFIAQRWSESVDDRLTRIRQGLGGRRTSADQRLDLKLQWRSAALRGFVEKGEAFVEGNSNGNGNGKHDMPYKKHPVPDYFALRYIKA